ncbi:hypothetical protein Pyrde_0788 [Pyrodictium delaneyi]|uniref:Radical SAM/SPASM domain-containing protein n=1 Tax=Pyrodictium delaneyi TaxID=1273541 RepID=A0A0P0N392_9CREN|nr:TIGR04084 family radical SAM/SPASM domain-containing protein [Pyrodictium delaneyi]ALL00838.1 hypothetical protein Pyrde_0788 [Pyrodictium delaneyi]OWJ55531.1 radical SAM/SPASM domain-containing protein [Pyrodictium delaneyi]
MLWFVLTTGACNLRCQYCGGGFPPEYSPPRPVYGAEKLVESIRRLDPDPVIFFYGGEPLVNPKLIMEVMDLLPEARYGIQTNGLLYRQLPEEYWARFHRVLLSIDGVEEITDRWRGRGVYRRVLKALRFLRELQRRRGGPGAVIARMAVTHDTVIDRDVLHLLLDLGFDKAHWQLDAVWSPPWPIGRWARESYLPGLRRLAKWVAEKPWERLSRVVPFHGIVSALYNGGYRWYPCGAGRDAVAVNTDGRILACPIAVREEWAVLGRLGEWRGQLAHPRLLPERCRRCSYLPLCGGRCLYAQMEDAYWPRELLEELDWVTRRTIDIVLSVVVPAVERALEKGLMEPSSVYYDPLEESTEVIP